MYELGKVKARARLVNGMLSVLIVVALLAGFFAKPWIDLWLAVGFPENEQVQDYETDMLLSYALLAHDMADAGQNLDMLSDLVSYYQEIGNGLADTELAAIMMVDPKYQVAKEVEASWPGVYVISVEQITDSSGTLTWVWLYAASAVAEMPDEEKVAVMEKALATAAEYAITDLHLQQEGNYVAVIWTDLEQIGSVEGVMATIASGNFGIWGSVEAWQKWLATDRTYDTLSTFIDAGEVSVYMSAYYGPIYPHEYLRRLSTNLLPSSEE